MGEDDSGRDRVGELEYWSKRKDIEGQLENSWPFAYSWD